MPGKRLFFRSAAGRHIRLTENSLKNIILFAVGIASACLVANMAKNSLFAGASQTLQKLVDSLSRKGLSKSQVALCSFTDNCKFILLLFFFSFTNVWRLYSRCFVFYMGVLHGVLLSCCLFFKGFSGILFYLALLIPHSLLLAPVYLLLLQRLEDWHKNCIAPEADNTSPDHVFAQKKRLLSQLLPLFFSTIFLLLLGAFLEGYLNVPLLQLFH